MQFGKRLYKRFVPSETRYWLYKIRNPGHFEALKRVVNPSPKGVFSLRHYVNDKAIFVHITKSAGTSVAFALYGELPYHYTAKQYRVIFGRKAFNQSFKFCFVRNPWDRLYSAYSYLKGGGWDDNDIIWANNNFQEVNDFNDFVLSWLSPEKLYSHIHFWPQSDFICNDFGRPIIDYLGYFETLNQDYNYIADRLKLPRTLQHQNASQREKYQDIYKPESIDRVAALYAKDIANFGYSFEGFNRKRIANRKFIDA